jgi:urease accessory protein
MTSTAALLRQRSTGAVKLVMNAGGIATLREAGASKVRLPRGSTEAILINTSGGLAGGDTISITAATGAGASLTLTSQAAERVYRSLGPPAEIDVTLQAAAGSHLFWLPQETILFDGAGLTRRYDVTLDDGAEFLALEAILFGRIEMGETIQQVSVRDRWRIRRRNALLHADDFVIDGPLPQTAATLRNAGAMATLIIMSERAEFLVDRLRAALEGDCAVSAWNGKLIARIVAGDGFQLRKTVIKGFLALQGFVSLPKVWTF